jgi:murein L,D-transpeptidase YcbB/YkuD
MIAATAQAVEPLRWVSGGKPTVQAQAMTHVLGEAERYGLSPETYEIQLSPAEMQLIASGSASPALLQRYSQGLSAVISQFVYHLRHGRISPRAAGFDLPPAVAEINDRLLMEIAGADDVEKTLEALEPQIAPYRQLKQALLRYRELATNPAIQPLPAFPGKSLRVGDTYAGAVQLRQILALLGDAPADTGTHQTEVLDATLVRALEHFQARHGLAVDGTLGRQTLAALNVPMQRRVRQIELALERWRWLGVLPRPDIVINIPQFMLYALPRPGRADDRLLEMPVIVGRTGDRTPIFTASIEQVVFNPYWDVPSSILRNELLPKIRKDASYLQRHHFEIVRGASDNAAVQAPTAEAIQALASGQFRLRQQPGADNALGPVKFVMPNRYSIRLHGTSEPGLFESVQRAFSHGCIRVSDPAALAEYVLANAQGQWDTEAVEAALCGTAPRRINLDTPVRVIVFYSTVAATRSLGVLFAPDLYGHDARLEQLLDSSS